MVGFSGHSIFPTLRNDMKDKTQYPKMVGVVYACSTAVHPEPYTLDPNPEPKTRNMQHDTLNPNPEPLTPTLDLGHPAPTPFPPNSKPYTQTPTLDSLKSESCNINSKTFTLNPNPCTPIPIPSTKKKSHLLNSQLQFLDPNLYPKPETRSP